LSKRGVYRPGSQIGGRDLKSDMPFKPQSWVREQRGGHSRNRQGRPGWVALRTAAPTMMVVQYEPEGDVVQFVYRSGRRTHVEREIAWSDLEGRPKQQDGRTLPNSKGTMYALFAKPRRKFESEEYLLSIGAGQWASMEAARQAVQEER